MLQFEIVFKFHSVCISLPSMRLFLLVISFINPYTCNPKVSSYRTSKDFYAY